MATIDAFSTSNDISQSVFCSEAQSSNCKRRFSAEAAAERLECHCVCVCVCVCVREGGCLGPCVVICDILNLKLSVIVLRRKLADARRGLETLMNKLQAAGSTGMMSPEDQQRWARLEADEQKLLRQLESVDGDGNGNGVSLHKDEPVTASSGSLGGDASRLPQRRHTREVSAFAMVSADVSRTFQSFDFSSGFTVVAMAQVRDVLVWPWVCVMTTEFRV